MNPAGPPAQRDDDGRQSHKPISTKNPSGSTARSGWRRRCSGVLDPALKRRGFATRDIITHWAAMAPKPYDQLAVPDQLTWPRGAGARGRDAVPPLRPGPRAGAQARGAADRGGGQPLFRLCAGRARCGFRPSRSRAAPATKASRAEAPTERDAPIGRGGRRRRGRSAAEALTRLGSAIAQAAVTEGAPSPRRDQSLRFRPLAPPSRAV